MLWMMLAPVAWAQQAEPAEEAPPPDAPAPADPLPPPPPDGAPSSTVWGPPPTAPTTPEAVVPPVEVPPSPTPPPAAAPATDDDSTDDDTTTPTRGRTERDPSARVVDEDGSIMGIGPREQVFAAGLAGGMWAGSMTQLALSGDVNIIGLGAGAAAGLAPAFLYASREDLPAAAGVRAGSYIAIGSWAGWELARAVVPLTDSDRNVRLAAASAFGDLSAMIMVPLVPTSPDLDVRDWVLIDGSGVAGWLAGAGIASLADAAPQQRAGIELAGGATMLTVGTIAANNDRLDANLIRGAYYTGQGAWIGAWTPAALGGDVAGSDVAAGAQIGASLGWVTSTIFDTGPRDLVSAVSSASWAAAGTAVGAGLPMTVLGDDQTQGTVRGMLAGGLAGSVAGTMLSDRYEATTGDVLILAGGQAWGIEQAALWSVAKPDSVPGAPLLAYGLGAVYGLAVPTFTDFDAGQAVAVGSAGAWGSSLAWLGGRALGSDTPFNAAVSAGLGDVGLLGATVAAAGLGWQPNLTSVAIVDGAGALGAGMGALGSAVLGVSKQGIAAGALVGGGTGLIAGAALAPRVQSMALLPLPELNLPFQVAVMPGPWTSEDGDLGVSLHAQVLARSRR
jgi:hypothetical protein